MALRWRSSPLTRSLVSCVVPLVLMGCSADVSPALSKANVTLKLKLPFTFNDRGALISQGLPFDSSGSTPIQVINVRIFDLSGNLMRFDGHGVYTPGGPQEAIQITAAQASAEVTMPPGTYTFQCAGLTGTSGGTFLAFGQLDRLPVTPGPDAQSVNLEVHTLTDPDFLSLTPALPVTYVVPGQTLDAVLNIMTPAAGGTRFRVPLGDFAVAYSAALSSVQITGSKLGARLQIAAQPSGSDVTVNADVQAWTADSGAAQTASIKPSRTALKLPLLSSAGVTIDLDPPTTTLVVPAASSLKVGQPVVLGGQTSDNVGVARVQVYEGPVLIGSSDSAEQGSGVVPVTFVPDASGHATTQWQMNWTPNAPGTTAIITVAADASGNDAEAHELIIVQP